MQVHGTMAHEVIYGVEHPGSVVEPSTVGESQCSTAEHHGGQNLTGTSSVALGSHQCWV